MGTMKYKSFKEFKLLREAESQANPTGGSSDWKSQFINLEKGFIPPPKMRPVIEAFLDAKKIKLTNDTGKAPTMPPKSLFLVGGPVRDFLAGKSIKDFDLATNATPEQIAHILHNAGFKMAPERGGSSGSPMQLTFTPEIAQKGDSKVWWVHGRDASKDRKPFVIGASVDGEQFEIATFRRDAKVTDGAAEVDFVDNPAEDASRRDLTINALYIELTSPDGENKKLYDPLMQVNKQSGWADLQSGIVRPVGKAEERFGEDKLRVMRAIRFHARFGKTPDLHEDIMKAIPKFKNMEGVALERIRDEFLKGLMHPDVDSRKYINIYKKTGLLDKVFPGVRFEPPEGVPHEITDIKDKPLALAWLLQHNPIERVAEALSSKRRVGEEEKPTGWTNQEKNAVLFLLKAKEFTPDQLPMFMKQRAGTGLSNDQIRQWVDMFNHKGTNRSSRPMWAKHVKSAAEYQRSFGWNDLVAQGKDHCPKCKGRGCVACAGSGKASENQRGEVIDRYTIDDFSKKLNGES